MNIRFDKAFIGDIEETPDRRIKERVKVHDTAFNLIIILLISVIEAPDIIYSSS